MDCLAIIIAAFLFGFALGAFWMLPPAE